MIQTNCPTCGALVQVRKVDTVMDLVAMVYIFPCPACARFVERKMDHRVAEVLTNGGVLTLTDLFSDHAIREGVGIA